MELRGDADSHKPAVEPLIIDPSLSSNPLSSSDDVEVAFSEDYVDSPQSTDTKSPLGSMLSDASDDRSSLGTIETEDDTEEVNRGKRQPDLHLSLGLSSPEQHVKTTAGQHDKDGEDDEFDARTVPRRSTSLKTCKTPPPDSARRKKEVRFADALGLDLESVKHIINSSEPPIVPVSAVKHLMLRSESADFVPQRRRLLHTCFSQPGMSRHFVERVTERRVSLETCLVTSSSIEGVIRVANIAYEKRVCVRYTMNGWLAFSDVTAGYVHGSSNGSTDQFRFSIALPENFGIINNAVEFSVRYEAGSGGGDCVYWDSNFGANYRVECYIS